MILSSKVISPLVVRRSPAILLSNVDFPVPDCPIILKNSFVLTVKSIDVTGLGQYIAANDGVKDKSALGTLAMCFVVGLCIAFVWQPLYRAAKQKFHY